MKDSSREFSEVLSISNEEDYQGSALNSQEQHAHASFSSPLPLLALNRKNIDVSENGVEGQHISVAKQSSTSQMVSSEDANRNANSGHESPDNQSQESVMTAISPTKDRKISPLSPKRYVFARIY